MSNYNTTLQTNNSSLEEIITQLNNMPDAGDGGIDTSDATASAGDILSGKTAYVDGNKITGTIATKTASNLTANGATVTVPSGYYASQVTKSVTTATQATPTITVNSSTGLITAKATQTAGYVTAGTKSATSQLAFKAAQTITPGTVDQTIAANTYLGGVQTIKGDANLVASNIVRGKSIFGVVGTATTGGGSVDHSAEDGLITRTITSYTNDRVSYVGSSAFYSNSCIVSVNFANAKYVEDSAFTNCSKLTTAIFPKATTIWSYAFYCCRNLVTISCPNVTRIYQSAFGYCSSLSTANFPNVIYIGDSAFPNCSYLTSVSFPKAQTIRMKAFYSCSRLTTVSFPMASAIMYSAFQKCSSLSEIYLTGSFVCQLSGSNVFSSTAITSTTGSIYVPASLVSSYQSASHWSYFANRIFGI